VLDPPLAGKNARSLGKQDRNYLFFPNAGQAQAVCNISRREEPLFRSLIYQAVITTRWEQYR
jgi:hypothetical protein